MYKTAAVLRLGKSWSKKYQIIIITYMGHLPKIKLSIQPFTGGIMSTPESKKISHNTTLFLKLTPGAKPEVLFFSIYFSISFDINAHQSNMVDI